MQARHKRTKQDRQDATPKGNAGKTENRTGLKTEENTFSGLQAVTMHDVADIVKGSLTKGQNKSRSGGGKTTAEQEKKQ